VAATGSITLGAPVICGGNCLFLLMTSSASITNSILSHVTYSHDLILDSRDGNLGTSDSHLLTSVNGRLTVAAGVSGSLNIASGHIFIDNTSPALTLGCALAHGTFQLTQSGTLTVYDPFAGHCGVFVDTGNLSLSNTSTILLAPDMILRAA